MTTEENDYLDWLAHVENQAQINQVAMPSESELKEWYDGGNSAYDVIDNIKNLSTEEKQDWYATCNGCGAHLTEKEVAYTNDEIGDDYCADCYEAIQGDDESSGRVKQED